MTTIKMLLVLIATVGLAGRIEAEKAHDVTAKELISPDELLATLGGSSLYSGSYNGNSRKGVGYKVTMLLEQTEDKTVAKTILGQFSVNDLLAVNDWDLNDCNEAKLKERGNFCENFITEEDARIRKLRDATPIGFTRLNLGLYCWSVIDDIQLRCPFRQLLARMGDRDDILEDFRVQLNDLLSVKSLLHKNKHLPTELLDGWFYKKTVKSLLGKKEPSEVEEFKKVCSMLLEGVAEYGVEFDRNSPWQGYIKICEVIGSNE